MPSSDWGDRARRMVLACSSTLLAACSALPSPHQSAALPAKAPVCTQIDAGAPLQNADTLLALRRSVETGPLYAAAAAASGVVAACHVRHDSGVTALDYRFGDGATLHVERDARIEYTEQKARLALPLRESAVDILVRAEQAVFGIAGCGIDWRRPETQAADGNPGAIDMVFRGDVCNCQARVRRDAAGRVVGLALRSAC